ncbi:MAG: ATP-binding cassette domain-containing protein [Candidatus Delongbacteria bacterium]|nr:ATP-binding cassette domain-containing protein [Candidatus Delongbacteria bacterium]
MDIEKDLSKKQVFMEAAKNLSRRKKRNNSDYNFNSKINILSKVFVIISAADGVISREELVYIKEFYNSYYPPGLSEQIYEDFKNSIRTDYTIEEVAKDFDKVSYGEKLFIIMKTYELIMLDTIDSRELDRLYKFAHLIKISMEDLKYIENLYRPKTEFHIDETKLSFTIVTLSDIPNWTDVFLPCPGLDAVIFKIDKTYFILKNDNYTNIKVKNYRISGKMRAVKIQAGSNIYINDYNLDFEQLSLFFKNKTNNHPGKFFFLNQKNNDIYLNEYSSDGNLATLQIKGSQFLLKKVDESTEFVINRKSINQSVLNVNLSDNIEINGSFLNLRKLVYQEILEKEFVHISRKKDTYTFSNQTSDIIVNDKLDLKWEGKITYIDGILSIYPGTCPHRINIVRGSKVLVVKNRVVAEVDSENPRYKKIIKTNGYVEIEHEDVIYLHGGTIIRVNLLAKVLEKTIFSFKSFVVKNLNHYFENGEKAIDDVSFEADHGDFICIMGPSGSGKSTLLKILIGSIKSASGEIMVDNFLFKDHYDKIVNFLSYVPQDDLLLANLTVYENLFYNAKLRDPKNSKEKIDSLISRVLRDIGLEHKKDQKVGTQFQKLLSGGERKRLNIGLELLEESNNIFLLDEPTSGLSSKDSEKVIEVLKRLSQKGKIVISVIHQPSSRIYKYFTKILLMDNGGKMAFYGNIYEALSYFGKSNSTISSSPECPNCKKVEPDLLLDSLEEPVWDIDGTILDRKSRRFSPDDWKDKFSKYNSTHSNVKITSKNLIPVVPFKLTRHQGRIKLLYTLLKRDFINKWRDKSNLIITFLVSPILALVISLILKYTPSDNYTLYNNLHIPTFVFLSVIVSMFLAMTNSGDEIIKDAEIRQREQLLNIGNLPYFISKYTTLIIFSAIQNLLFVLISFFILEIRENQINFSLFLMFVSLCGISLGLFISSIPGLTSKAAYNIIPLILIPQIIFGGALIKYRDMNKSLTLYKKSPIPEICQFMPSRWAYEGLMVDMYLANSFHRGKDKLQHELDSLVINKDNLVKTIGRKRYEQVKDSIMNFEMVEFRKKYQKEYGNLELYSAIKDVNETYSYDEHLNLKDYDGDYRVINPMFLLKKKVPYIEKMLTTPEYNTLILVFYSFFLNILTLLFLSKRKFIIKLLRKRK